VLSLLTEATVFTKNQRRILVPEDALYEGLSNCRMTQFPAKLCVIRNSQQHEAKIGALPFCNERLLTIHTFS